MLIKKSVFSDCLNEISEKRWPWWLGWGESGMEENGWAAPALSTGHTHRWQCQSPGIERDDIGGKSGRLL